MSVHSDACIGIIPIPTEQYIYSELIRYYPHMAPIRMKQVIADRIAHCFAYSIAPEDYQYNEGSEYNEETCRVEYYVRWTRTSPKPV